MISLIYREKKIKKLWNNVGPYKNKLRAYQT